MTAGEVEAVFGGALRALPPAPTHFILYFQKDSTRLTPESQALLPLVMAAVRERAPADVSVVGHTDTAGEGRRNYELGLKRAQTVAEMLSLEDLTPAGLQVTSHGEENPLVPTPDDVAEPRNRRVEVIVR
jgi:outer membrane protein OmpA-like peptidoglycan-associated protein